MSLAAQVLSQVRGLIAEVSDVLHRKDAEQDTRMDALEARVTALENGTPEATAAPAKRGPGRPRKTQNVSVEAGTAEGTGEASST